MCNGCAQIFNTPHIFYSKTWAWKKLKDVGLLPKFECLGFDSVVSVFESLHWLITSNNMVFVFHINTNKWTTFHLPFPLCKKNYFNPMKFVEYQGCVGMLVRKNKIMKYGVRNKLSIEPAKLSTCCYPIAFQSSNIMLLILC
ncbi:hypothetical protein CFP56_020293 [Quercus suber]|uniref:Uncharacterized protein n=1 Tax=Quercus suber TaxID=58331 RepID=A0AAW0KHP4_QUESU